MRKTLFLLALLAQPALADIASPVLLERSRVARALSDEQRDRAHQLALHESATATPEQYLQAVEAQLRPDDPPLAFVVYAGVAHLELRERIMRGYAERLNALRHAEEALRHYLARCGSGPDESQPTPPIETPQEDLGLVAPLEIQSDDTGLRIYRLLPWPDHVDEPGRKKLQSEAEQDLALCRRQQKQVVTARFHYQGLQHDWELWARTTTLHSATHTETWLKLERAGKPTGKH